MDGTGCASPVPTFKPVGGDTACLRTAGQGWLHLSTAIGLSTRMVAGRPLSSRMTADIAVNALASAKARGYAAENAIFHSGEGTRCTSRLLAGWARDNDVRLSCSRTGNCHDSAVTESFFATLENGMHCRESFATGDAAKMAVIEFIEFIESYYNRRRPHSSIGCRISAEAIDISFERAKPMEKAIAMAA